MTAIRNSARNSAIGFAFAAAAAGFGPAWAGNPVECYVYANQAVQHQAANLQNQCGYAGPRWLSDTNLHIAWCLGATKGQMNAERNARIAMLAACSGGGAPPPPLPPAVALFSEPKIGGWRLDWCKFWAAQCGAPAAHAYCQAKGFSHSTGFAPASNIGSFAPTRVIGTGQVCNGPNCDGFAWIKCSG
jgi:hypothetical protein